MNTPKNLFATLILPHNVDMVFTYRIPENLSNTASPGKRAIVQFGHRKFYTGMILEITDKAPEGIKPKDIEIILDEEPIISDVHLKFWKWVSDYYFCSLGDVMKTALPAGLRIESETKIELNPALKNENTEHLTIHEKNIYNALLEKENISVTEIQKITGIKNVQSIIKNLLSKNIAVTYEEYAEKYVPKKITLIKLNAQYDSNEELFNELLNKLTKKAPKQLAILMEYLNSKFHSAKEFNGVDKTVLSKRCSYSALQSLIKKNILTEHERIISRFENDGQSEDLKKIKLTEHQEQAYKEINESFQKKRVVLLHGITSSGKTEIYIKLIEQVLNEKKQVLYLLPEIALTAQIIKRLKTYFGNLAGVFHHKFNYNEKIEIWNSVGQDSDSNKFRIIIGTRSALFLPFKSLGLIIVDDEHDSSYKQSDISPYYNARDAAIYFSNLVDAKVLLGTATPSIESYFNTIHAKYELVNIMQRYMDLPLPEVKIVNMSKQFISNKKITYLSNDLRIEIERALENEQQIILFQNRRGFAPIVECSVCGWIPECENCDISLTYHKHIDHLKCHICGYLQKVPPMCMQCGNKYLKFLGFGTEKVEDELRIIFPTARIERLDADTARAKYAHQRITGDFEDGKIDIIVGTQMITKGLDFKNVSLVGILNADSLLHFPDFRSHERAFQLLTQIIGRAGRKDNNGKVILQTRNPEHPIIQMVANYNFTDFFNSQISERKEYKYPPYTRLIEISVRHKDMAKALSTASQLKKSLNNVPEIIILGPEEPYYSRIKSYYLKNILIKMPRTQNLSETRKKIKEIITNFRAEKINSGTRIIVIADPI